jgi:hypothetical protein
MTRDEISSSQIKEFLLLGAKTMLWTKFQTCSKWKKSIIPSSSHFSYSKETLKCEEEKKTWTE